MNEAGDVDLCMDNAAIDSRQNLLKKPKRFGAFWFLFDRRRPDVERSTIFGMWLVLPRWLVLGKSFCSSSRDDELLPHWLVLSRERGEEGSVISESPSEGKFWSSDSAFSAWFQWSATSYASVVTFSDDVRTSSTQLGGSSPDRRKGTVENVSSKTTWYCGEICPVWGLSTSATLPAWNGDRPT